MSGKTIPARTRKREESQITTGREQRKRANGKKREIQRTESVLDAERGRQNKKRYANYERKKEKRHARKDRSPLSHVTRATGDKQAAAKTLPLSAQHARRQGPLSFAPLPGATLMV